MQCPNCNLVSAKAELPGQPGKDRCLRCASISDYIQYPMLAQSVPLWQAQTEELTLQSFATPRETKDGKPLLTTPLPEARRAAIAKLGAQRFNAMATAVTPGIEFHNKHIGRFSTPDKKLVNKLAFVGLCATLAKLTETGEDGERIGSVLHGTLERVGGGLAAHEYASHAFVPEEAPLNVISDFPTEPMGNVLYEPEELDLDNVDAFLPRMLRGQATLGEGTAALITSATKSLGPSPSNDEIVDAIKRITTEIGAAVLRNPTVAMYKDAQVPDAVPQRLPPGLVEKNGISGEVFAAMATTMMDARLPSLKQAKAKETRADFEFKVIKNTLSSDVFAQKLAKYVAEYVKATSHKQVKSQREYLNSLRTKGQEIYKEAVGILQKSEFYGLNAYRWVGLFLYFLFYYILVGLDKEVTAEHVRSSYLEKYPQ